MQKNWTVRQPEPLRGVDEVLAISFFHVFASPRGTPSGGRGTECASRMQESVRSRLAVPPSRAPLPVRGHGSPHTRKP